MEASVEVSREQLKAALETFRRTMQDDEWRTAFLEFEEGCLAVYCGGNSVRVAASGDWPGRARVASDILARMSQALPPEDPLTVAVDGDQLHLGSVKLPCGWDASGRPRIDLPINPNLKALLQISRSYDAATIKSSGVAALVALAEDRLNEKLDRASRYLENLDVTRSDLVELVEGKLESSGPPESLLGPNQRRLPLRFDGEQLGLGDD